MATKIIHSILPQHTDLLNTDQAAAYIGVTPRTLEVWRCTKRYPISFIKVGRLVKYRQSALDDFLDQQTVDVNRWRNKQK